MMGIAITTSHAFVVGSVADGEGQRSKFKEMADITDQSFRLMSETEEIKSPGASDKATRVELWMASALFVGKLLGSEHP